MLVQSKLLVGAVAGMMGLAVAGSPALVGKHEGRLANTPLGRMVTGNFGRLMVLRSEVNLTDEQRDKVKGVVKAHKSEILTEAKAVAEHRRALRNAVLTEKPDEAAIRKAAEDLGREIGNAAVLAAKIKGEVAPVLTGRQKELVKQCIADCEKAADRFFEEAGTAK
jgi:Spy/CpxP family protein refolding chaperone